MTRVFAGGLGLAALVVALDQATKQWIVGSAMREARVIEVLPFLNIVMAWNRGVSFGLFNDDGLSPWVFFTIAVVFSIAMTVWMARTRSRLLAAALGLMIGGALGNAVDRVRWGAVADFIDLHVAGWHWPAFNVADAAITVGAVLLVADSLFRRAD